MHYYVYFSLPPFPLYSYLLHSISLPPFLLPSLRSSFTPSLSLAPLVEEITRHDLWRFLLLSIVFSSLIRLNSLSLYIPLFIFFYPSISTSFMFISFVYQHHLNPSLCFSYKPACLSRSSSCVQGRVNENEQWQRARKLQLACFAFILFSITEGRLKGEKSHITTAYQCRDSSVRQCQLKIYRYLKRADAFTRVWRSNVFWLSVLSPCRDFEYRSQRFFFFFSRTSEPNKDLYVVKENLMCGLE